MKPRSCLDILPCEDSTDWPHNNLPTVVVAVVVVVVVVVEVVGGRAFNKCE